MGWDGPITHRQFTAWCEYVGKEDTKPSLLHFYLMQIALEVRRVGCSFMKSPPTLKLGDFELIFKVPEVVKPMTDEQKRERAAQMKSVWKARLGG